ncbi:MAG: erythromycin esterase family protein [Pseudomonadales bacterium]|nr:erythromycin esterase family protein [Pseudomonadales bacterium]
MAWAKDAAQPVSEIGIDAPTTSLSFLKEMIGEARIVGFSEAVHGGTEPMAFRNTLFRFLVEEMNFAAIVLESGLTESRVLNDYVTGSDMNLADAVRQGFTFGFHDFRQNAELLRWLREYNDALGADEPKIEIFGIDVSGSPGNLGAPRNPDTALLVVLDYLDAVNTEVAARYRVKVQDFLPALSSTNNYGPVPEAERNGLTATINDLISHLERYEFEYTAASSRLDYAWALQSAISARQVDNWFRNMPQDWVLSDGVQWNQVNLRVRDRLLADNLDWVLGMLAPDSRVLVFTSVAHSAKTPVYEPGSTEVLTIPMGRYLDGRFDADYVNILNMVNGGEIAFCSAPKDVRQPMLFSSPPRDSAEFYFSQLGMSRYLVDLREAPEGLAEWLAETRQHWNGLGALVFPTSEAFDLVYYGGEVGSDCVN